MTRATAIATGLVAVLAVAAPAAAHVEIDPAEVPSGGEEVLSFQVPHGCDGSPTKSLSIQIPDTVPEATPQVHPGWDVATKDGAKQPVEVEGEKIASGVSEVTWTAADAGPLPPDRLDVFSVSVALPEGKVGDSVYFPAVQTCVKGETRWIELPKPGQGEEDLENPAPSVTLTATGGEHGDHGATEEISAAAAADDGSDDDSDDKLPLGLGIAALALSVVALMRSRRTPDA